MPQAVLERQRLKTESAPPSGRDKYAAPFDLYESIGKHLRLPTLASGIVAGFAACAILGHYAPLFWPIKHFQRFHHFINESSDYFPTANQMLTVVRKQVPRHKILVVIGGGSVTWGASQSAADVWSHKLQEKLGDRYAVVNLALPANGAFEAGYLVFEQLRREYPRAIFITSGLPKVRMERPAKGGRAAYLFYDCLFKGYLENFPPRLEPPGEADSVRNDLYIGDERQERWLGGLLDSFLRFQDLWNAVGYQHFFTVYTTTTEKSMWRARRAYADPEWSYPSQTKPDEKWLNRRGDGTIPGLSRRFYKDAGKKKMEKIVAKIMEEAELQAPKDVRPQIILMHIDFSPLYKSTLDETEKAALNRRWIVSDAYRKCGYQVVDLKDRFEQEDYADFVHHTPKGGQKLAAIAAQAIEKRACALGYLR
ncbi:MAG TPA: hypothetical protein V6D17_12900 [Candidatus Obscuribacterales bacterium]